MSSHHETSNLINIAQHVASGELPSNKMIKEELKPLKEHLEEKERLSTGQAKEDVLKATKGLVEAVEDVLDTKNKGDRLQKLVDAATRVAGKTHPKNLPDAQRVWDETKEFALALKDSSTSLINSKDFRKALVDLFDLLKDILNIEDDKHGLIDKAKEGFVEGKPVEAAQKIADTASEAVKNLPDEIPEQQKQELRKKLKNLLIEIRDQADTSNAIKKFFKFLSLLQRQIQAKIDKAQIDEDVQEIEDLSTELVDSFLDGKSVKSLLDKVKSVFEQIQHDEELSIYIKDCRELIERPFQKPELIESDSYYDEAERLYSKGRKLAKKYKNDKRINKLIDEASELLLLIRSDSQLNELQYRAGKVVSAFTTTDLKGNTVVDYDVVAAMRAEIVPFFIERMKEVPVPGFRLESPEFEYLEVHQLYVTLSDVLPDRITIHARNDTDLTLKDMDSSAVQSESIVKVKIEGVRPEFNDFFFTFKRRGLIGISDEGRANLKIKGKGICIYMHFDLELDKEGRTILGKLKVDIKMDTVELEILEAEHKTLLNIAASLFSQKIQAGVEASLLSAVEKLGGDWSAYINKKLLYNLPTLTQIGSNITKSTLEPITNVLNTAIKAETH